jgi:hypothetical protein
MWAWRQTRRFDKAFVIFSVAIVLQGQNPSPWHGRVLGVGSSYPPNGPSQQVLTYTDMGPPWEHGRLTQDFALNYVLDAGSTIYVWKRSLVSDKEHQIFEILPLENMRANRKTIECTAVCTACPSCRYCKGGAQMAISPDGRYVFALIERLQEHHTTFAPGVIATDDDASFYEEIVLTYDSKADRFLPDRVSLFLGQPVAYSLLPSSEPESFEILTFYPSIRLARYSMHGSERQNGVVLGESSSGTLVQAAWDSTNARTLLLCSNGNVIEVKGHLKDVGRIDPTPALRQMHPASLSGDGKLLFVPSGPAGTRGDRYFPPSYTDQIDVYDATNFTKLRTLRSQRALGQVVPNRDGTRLYTPGASSVLILNSESLWQEEVHPTDISVGRITLIP